MYVVQKWSNEPNDYAILFDNFYNKEEFNLHTQPQSSMLNNRSDLHKFVSVV